MKSLERILKFSQMTCLFMCVFFALQSSGCKSLKKEKEQQKIEEASAAQSKIEEKRISTAKQEVLDAVRMYNGLAGDYQGIYTANEGLKVFVTMRITTMNAPSDFVLTHSGREGELLTYKDALNLTIDLDEYRSQNSPDKLFTCSVTGLKPDFRTGVFRLVCPTQSGGGSRTYVMAMNQMGEEQPPEYASLDTVQFSAKLVSSQLADDKIKTIDALNFAILGVKNNFFGRLVRSK